MVQDRTVRVCISLSAPPSAAIGSGGTGGLRVETRHDPLMTTQSTVNQEIRESSCLLEYCTVYSCTLAWPVPTCGLVSIRRPSHPLIPDSCSCPPLTADGFLSWSPGLAWTRRGCSVRCGEANLWRRPPTDHPSSSSYTGYFGIGGG